MANSVRKNTVKLVFGPSSKVPTHLEVLKFTIGNLKLSAADIHTIYKDENGGQFYVKLMDEATFSAFIVDSEEQYSFKYDDGSETNVQVDQACRIFRYVRIFNLPPEIEDREISYVLGQYGTIRQHVRERFPNEMNVDIFTGVRGVHMEISKEIPAHLFVGHFRARVYYEGLKNKCFYCKSEGHVKTNCPKLANATSGDANQKEHSSKSTGSTSLGRPSKPVIDVAKPTPANMTVLPSKQVVADSSGKNASNTSSQPAINTPSPSAQSNSTGGEHVVPRPTDSNQRQPDVSIVANGTQSEYMDDDTSEQARALIKRSMNTSSEGSDNEDVSLREGDGKLSYQKIAPGPVSGNKGTKPKKKEIRLKDLI